jgi:hypothetical protein
VTDTGLARLNLQIPHTPLRPLKECRPSEINARSRQDAQCINACWFTVPCEVPSTRLSPDIATTYENHPGIRNMMKVTTTKATHRGVDIVVMSESDRHVTRYSCTNTSGRRKLIEKWFTSEGEAIANERREIDAVLR